MRVLLPPDRAGELLSPDPDEAALRLLYADPGGRWLRACMVSSVDGAATGADGRSGSLSTAADRRVFAVLRSMADVVLVGAGTVRKEGYGPEPPAPAVAARRLAEGRPPAPPFAVVTRTGDVPASTGMFEAGVGTLVVTCPAAGPRALARLREVAGSDAVVVTGADEVDLLAALDALAERGLRRVLCEGGPTLLGAVAASGALDELCLTWSPALASGPGVRPLTSPVAITLPARPAHLLVGDDGTLLGRWLVQNPSRPAVPTGGSRPGWS